MSTLSDPTNPVRPRRGGARGAWRRFRSLSSRERRLRLVAWWALLRADLALRLAPRRTLAQALSPSSSHSAAVRHPPDALARAIASAAAHHLWPMRCLPRAVALRRLLVRSGVSSVVVIGVRREGGGLAAHAWVDVAGQPLGEPEAIDLRYARLLPSAGEEPPAPGAEIKARDGARDRPAG